MVAGAGVLESGTLQHGDEACAVRADRDAFHALIHAAAIQICWAVGEVGRACRAVRHEGRRDGNHTVDLLAGVEVIDERAVFVADPAFSGLSRAVVEDEPLGIEGEAVGNGAVGTDGGAPGDGGNGLAEEIGGGGIGYQPSGEDGRSAAVGVVIVSEA